jgi:DNA polymerase III subunit beta
MKLQVLQENLAKALLNASRFANQRAQLPVLGNIKLSTKKTKLQIASTNLEVSISVSVGAQIEKEGEITIPAKVITELISNLMPGTINIEAEKEQLKISSSGFSSTVSGMNTSDFPSIPQSIDAKTSIVLPKKEFLDALSQVSFATSVDESRPILTGVLFIFQKDALVLVATDGFRLSQKKIKIANLPKLDQVVLPRSPLGELSRLSEEADEILFNLKKTDNQITFGINDTILSSRILEGEYPNFEKIIPKEATIKVEVDKDELLRAVKLASVFARDSANIVKLNINKGSVDISAESSNAGNQKTKIDAKVTGEKFEIDYNYRFLEDFLHIVKGETVSMEFSSPTAPGVFGDSSDTNFLHLIMPVRIQS